jgi:tRNA modification GTPase
MAVLFGWTDTIVAPATPPGIGALAIIRLSGKNAIDIVDSLVPGKDLKSKPSHTLHLCLIEHEGYVLDESVISIYKSPKSFTGEDVAEITCHGSDFILQSIIRACTSLGARPARAGEFTQRAFLNGKMDLIQAEAIADLIVSDTSAAQRTAMHNMRGGFSEELKDMRESLIQFAALIELELDFATEDVEFADRHQIEVLVAQILEQVKNLMDSFAFGNVIRNGVKVAIIGKPNAGKSTLLNTLLNEERAIVSDVAGTTRDTIEETLYLEGIAFRFIDTAGIREHSQDMIEQIGISRSIEKMQQADIVLYLFDVETETRDTLKKELEKIQNLNRHVIVVANKTDKNIDKSFDLPALISISARNATGVEQLKKELMSRVLTGEQLSEGTVITNARHYASLKEVYKALTAVQSGLQNRISGDLLSTDINRALYYLGEITGEVTNEDKLDYIFSKFCIGK